MNIKEKLHARVSSDRDPNHGKYVYFNLITMLNKLINGTRG